MRHSFNGITSLPESEDFLKAALTAEERASREREMDLRLLQRKGWIRSGLKTA